jgi:CRISPR-associated protein (TIGR03986 family)
MPLPVHQNPIDNNQNLIPDRTASAPYNFVPLPERIVKAVEGAAQLPSHDTYANDGYPHTGYFVVKLTTKSPLYVRCPFTRDEFDLDEQGIDRNRRKIDNQTRYADRIKNTPHFFYTRGPDQPVIPGSSPRGMLRNLLEIVSYGKVERVTDSIKVYFRAVAAPKDDPLTDPYRQTLGRFGSNVRAGYLVRVGDEWEVRPAKRPADVGWREEKKAYLTVKEKIIADDVIPGFIPLNSPGYRPQYHHVSFNVEKRRGKRGQFIAVTQIGSPGKGYPHRGVLVCSGNMLETGGEETVSPRRAHALVLEADDSAKRLKINVQAVADYLDALTPFQKTEPPFDEHMGCLVNERPIFYVEEQGEILFFGHSPNFRIPSLLKKERRAATPLDFVPSALRRPEDIDYAEALFGYTKGKEVNAPQGSKIRAYASRVFVTEATLKEEQTAIWLSAEPVVPKILASPKPTAFQHYLTQREPNEKARLDHYGSPPPHDTVIRGHKLYWHQADRTVNNLRPEPRSPNVDENGNVNSLSTQHTQFKPVKSGVTFTFRVYFENLSDQELGALCWVLHPLGDEQQKYYHSLGMGKPLGMGAVKLDATLYLTDRAARYGSLFDGDNWQTGAQAGQQLSNRDTLERLTREFEKHILGELGLDDICPRLADLKRIGMLLKMLEWPGFPAQLPASLNNRFLSNQKLPNTRYMVVRLPNSQNEYRNRLVLPDPSRFGQLTGETVPIVQDDQPLPGVAQKEDASKRVPDKTPKSEKGSPPEKILSKPPQSQQVSTGKRFKKGDKVQAEIITKSGDRYTLRVLELGQKAEVVFEKPYWPRKVGERVKAIVESVGQDGQIKKIKV